MIFLNILWIAALFFLPQFVILCQVPSRKIFCKIREDASSSLLKIIDLDPCLCTDFVLDLQTTSSGFRLDTDETEYLRKKIGNKRRKESPSIQVSIAFQNVSKQKPQQLSMFFKDHKLNGIIIKWEDEDANTIMAFLKDFQPFLRNYSISLRLTNQGMSSASAIDFKNISGLVDYVILPVYYWDSVGDKRHRGTVRRIADMDTLDSIIGNLLRWGVPKSMIIFTVPTFGIQTIVDNGRIKSVTRVPHSKVCENRKSKGWNLEREMDQTSPFISKDNTTFAFDDEISLKLKVKYIILQKLAGIFVTTVSEDDSDNLCKKDEYPLLRSIYKIFSGRNYQNSTSIDDLKEYLNNSESKILIKKSGDVAPYNSGRILCSREGYYQYPGNCRLFYRCVKYHQLSDDFTIFHYGCPPGLVFDEKYEVCNWPSWSDHCIGSGEIINVPRRKFTCPGPGYFRDSENCRWFYYCSDHYINGIPRPYEFKCPYDLAYDEVKHLCNWRWLVLGCGKREVGVIKPPPILGHSNVGEIPDYIKKPFLNVPPGPIERDQKKEEIPNSFVVTSDKGNFFPPALQEHFGMPEFDTSKELSLPYVNGHAVDEEFPSDVLKHLHHKSPFSSDAGFTVGSTVEHDGHVPQWPIGVGLHSSNIHLPFSHPETSLRHKLLSPIHSLHGAISQGKHLIWNPISKLKSFLHGIFSLVTAGIPVTLFNRGKFGESPFTVTAPIHPAPFPEPKFPSPPVTIKNENFNKPSPPVNIFIINTGNTFEKLPIHQKLPNYLYENSGAVFQKLPDLSTGNIPLPVNPIKHIYHDYKYIPLAPIKNEDADNLPPLFPEKPNIDSAVKPFQNANENYEERPSLPKEVNQNLPPDNKPEAIDRPLPPLTPEPDNVPPPPKSGTYRYKNKELRPQRDPDDDIQLPPRPNYDSVLERPEPDNDNGSPRPNSYNTPQRPELDDNTQSRLVENAAPIPVGYNRNYKQKELYIKPNPCGGIQPPTPLRPESYSNVPTSAKRLRDYSYNYKQSQNLQSRPDCEEIGVPFTRPELENGNPLSVRPVNYNNHGLRFVSSLEPKPELGLKPDGIPLPDKPIKYFNGNYKDVVPFPLSRPESDVPKTKSEKYYNNEYRNSGVPPGFESDVSPPAISLNYYNRGHKLFPAQPPPPPEQDEDDSKNFSPTSQIKRPNYYDNQYKPILNPSTIPENGNRGAPLRGKSWSYQRNNDHKKVESFEFDKTRLSEHNNRYFTNDRDIDNKPKPDYGINLLPDDLYPKSACIRPGLFRHYENCNKFYECYWDKWINKFTLHSFECPVKLVFDENILGCSSPSAKIPCGRKK